MKWLFLHGAYGSKDKWRELKKELPDFQADFIDLQGHGGNKEPIPDSIEQYANQLECMIDEDVIVVGHSMGGLIGIELASRTPYVKGLVLAASHYRLPVHPKFLQSLAEGHYPDKFFYAAYGKQVDPDLLEEEKKQHDEGAIQTALADFTSCNEYNGKPTLASLKVPVLAIYGDEDRMIPANSREKLAVVYPKAELEIIDGAGHYVILEKPKAFADALRRFRGDLKEVAN